MKSLAALILLAVGVYAQCPCGWWWGGGWMPWGGWGFVWMILGFILAVLFLAFVVLLVLWLYRQLFKGPQPHH